MRSRLEVSTLLAGSKPSIMSYSLQEPPVLSQQVLLSLLQQLGYDLSRDSTTKLTWIQDAALALDPQVCPDPPKPKPCKCIWLQTRRWFLTHRRV